MITVLRSYFKRGSQVVLWIIILTFVVGLMPLAFRQVSNAARWAIRVNGQDIAYQEYLLEYERWKERLAMIRAQFGEYADLLLARNGIESPQGQAAQSLIKQELINQFADRIGVRLSSEFVAEKLSDPSFVTQSLGDLIPRQLVDPVAGIDQAMLKRYLKHFNLSIDMFERIIEKMLIEQFVGDVFKSAVYIPRFDREQHYILQHAKRKFSVLTLPIKPFLDAENNRELAADQIQHFYDTNKQQYTVPEKRTGMKWEFDPTLYAIEVSSKQIETYYENNKVKQFIDTPARVQVRRILFAVTTETDIPTALDQAERTRAELLNNKASFAQVAARLSDDKQTAANGGLMEPFSRGAYEIAFDRAAFLLKEDGDISEVIRTEQGYEIAQRVQKTPQTFKSLVSVRDEINKKLLDQAFRTQVTADMKKVIGSKESLAALIKKHGGHPQAIEHMELDDTLVAQQIFKLQPGEATFFVDGDKGIALQLDTIQERYIPTLDSIKDTVIHNMRQERAKKALSSKLDEAKQAIRTGSLSEFRKQFDGDIFKTNWIEPHNEQDIAALKEMELPVSKMVSMEKVGSLLSTLKDDRGQVISLEQLDVPKNEESSAVSVQEKQAFDEQRMRLYMQGFVASLRRNATIETNESIITLES